MWCVSIVKSEVNLLHSVKILRAKIYKKGYWVNPSYFTMMKWIQPTLVIPFSMLQLFDQHFPVLAQITLTSRNWLSVVSTWSLMKIVVSVSVKRHVPEISSSTQRTAAALSAERVWRAAARSTRYFTQTPAGECLFTLAYIWPIDI